MILFRLSFSGELGGPLGVALGCLSRASGPWNLESFWRPTSSCYRRQRSIPDQSLFSYRIDGDGGALTGMSIYRSADAIFDPSDLRLVTETITDPTSISVGSHTRTLAVSGGLTIDPSRPFVLAVADPATWSPRPTRGMTSRRSASTSSVACRMAPTLRLRGSR